MEYSLAGAKEIHRNASRLLAEKELEASKLLEQTQFEIEHLKHSIQSDYFALRRQAGTAVADEWMDYLKSLPF